MNLLPALLFAVNLTQLLPPPAEFQATAEEEPRVYTDDLYEYINGAAEAFHMYDMVRMVNHEYTLENADVTVDIYDMGDPLNAFGIYSAERSPEYRFLDVGAEGYISEFALNFVQGRYYVKLSAFSRKEGEAPPLEAFARSISKRIAPSGRLPDELKLFPPENLVERSQKYLRGAPLGHAFLAPVFAASYRLDRRESTLALSIASSPAEASERVRRLREHFAKTGKATPETALDGAWRVSSEHEGEMVVLARGPYAVLLVNPPDSPRDFFGEVLRRIEKER